MNNKGTKGQFSGSCIWLEWQEKTTYLYKHESQNWPLIKKCIFGVSYIFGAEYFLAKYREQSAARKPLRLFSFVFYCMLLVSP